MPAADAYCVDRETPFVNSFVTFSHSFISFCMTLNALSFLKLIKVRPAQPMVVIES